MPQVLELLLAPFDMACLSPIEGGLELGKALLNVRHAAVIFQDFNGSGKTGIEFDSSQCRKTFGKSKGRE
jgi:hypothetical protein